MFVLWLIFFVIAVPLVLVAVPVWLITLERRVRESLDRCREIDQQQTANGASILMIEKRIAKLERSFSSLDTRPTGTQSATPTMPAQAASPPIATRQAAEPATAPQSPARTPFGPTPQHAPMAQHAPVAQSAPPPVESEAQPAPPPLAPLMAGTPPLDQIAAAELQTPPPPVFAPQSEPKPTLMSDGLPIRHVPLDAGVPPDVPDGPALQQQPAFPQQQAELQQTAEFANAESIVAPAFAMAAPTFGMTAPTFGIPAPAESEESTDWETRVGTNWFSRLGVAALVIGMALFVGYSFANMDAMGRVVLAAVLSASMLGGGVMLERRPSYRILGRGLIGGGWAGIYLTSFAAYGVEAARIITDPLLATVLLFAAAVGMVAHSLRYRSQALTTLAFALAAVSLGVSDSFGLAIGALFPLAGALLVIAHRLRWPVLRLVGAASCYTVVAVLLFFRDSVMATSTLSAALVCLWALFEFAAWIAIRRKEEPGMVPFVLGTGNAVAFLGLLAGNGGFSMMAGGNSAHLEFTALLGAALMTMAACARAWFLRNTDTDDGDIGSLLAEGAYLPFAALAAACLAAFGVLHFEGSAEVLALMGEGIALLVLAAVSRQPYLARLADAVFVCSLLLVYGGGISREPVLAFASTSWSAEALLALGHTVVFYVNRALFPRRAYYSVAATALMLITLYGALPPFWLGVGIFLVALGLVEAARRAGTSMLLEAWATLAIGALTSIAVWFDLSHQLSAQWLPLAVTSALLYLATWRLGSVHRALNLNASAAEHAVSVGAGAVAATALAVLLPSAWICAAWIALGVLWLEIGRMFAPRILVAKAYTISIAGFLVMCGAGQDMGGILRMSPEFWLVHLLPVAMFFWIWHRSNQLAEGPNAPSWLTPLTWIQSAMAAGVLVVLAKQLADGEWFALLMIAIGLLFTILGTAFRRFELRAEGYVLGLLGTVPASALLPAVAGEWMGFSQQTIAGLLGTLGLLALFGLAQLASRTREGEAVSGIRRQVDAIAPQCFALLAGVYSVYVLSLVVEGRMLTICLGLEALVILALGVAASMRFLRIGALCLLLFTVGKLFLFDLSSLVMPYRIASVFILGLLLLGVSWGYSRFGSRMRKLL